MSEKQEKIIFISEDQEQVEFFVLEQTKINGESYILVADSDNEEEANALILKEISGNNEGDTIYDIVEDSKELEAISKVFMELLEDVDIELMEEE